MGVKQDPRRVPQRVIREEERRSHKRGGEGKRGDSGGRTWEEKRQKRVEKRRREMSTCNACCDSPNRICTILKNRKKIASEMSEWVIRHFKPTSYSLEGTGFC